MVMCIIKIIIYDPYYINVFDSPNLISAYFKANNSNDCTQFNGKGEVHSMGQSQLGIQNVLAYKSDGHSLHHHSILLVSLRG